MVHEILYQGRPAGGRQLFSVRSSKPRHERSFWLCHLIMHLTFNKSFLNVKWISWHLADREIVGINNILCTCVQKQFLSAQCFTSSCLYETMLVKHPGIGPEHSDCLFISITVVHYLIASAYVIFFSRITCPFCLMTRVSGSWLAEIRVNS